MDRIRKVHLGIWVKLAILWREKWVCHQTMTKAKKTKKVIKWIDLLQNITTKTNKVTVVKKNWTIRGYRTRKMKVWVRKTRWKILLAIQKIYPILKKKVRQSWEILLMSPVSPKVKKELYRRSFRTFWLLLSSIRQHREFGAHQSKN